jgi:Ni,Fe-hydrogenase III component G
MPPKSFTPEQLNELKNEFDTLTTVEERLNFWKNRIGFRYSLWSELDHYGNTEKVIEQRLDQFYIKPTSHATYKEETEELNRLILIEVKETDIIRSKKKLTSFDDLKTKLDEKISKSVRPIHILEDEKKSLEVLIESYRQEESNEMFDMVVYNRNQAKKAWVKGFDNYYYYGEEPDYSRITSETVYLTSFYNGCEIAKYKEYIENRIKNPSIKKVSASNKETTLKQQLLMLHVTGMLEFFHDWKQKDREQFLAVLLNKSQQNIKQAFTRLHSHKPEDEVWTITNLEFLVDQLSKIDKDEINNKVKKLKLELNELKNQIDKEE